MPLSSVRLHLGLLEIIRPSLCLFPESLGFSCLLLLLPVDGRERMSTLGVYARSSECDSPFEPVLVGSKHHVPVRGRKVALVLVVVVVVDRRVDEQVCGVPRELETEVG